MPTMLIQYTVRPDQVTRTVQLLREFFGELDATQPGDLRYSSFQLDDGVSFAHLVETGSGARPFASLPAYRAFRDTIAERCDQPPAMSELREIGMFISPGRRGHQHPAAS